MTLFDPRHAHGVEWQTNKCQNNAVNLSIRMRQTVFDTFILTQEDKIWVILIKGPVQLVLTVPLI